MPKDFEQEKFDKENEELFEMLGFNEDKSEKMASRNKLEEVLSRLTNKKKARPKIIYQNLYGQVLLVKNEKGEVVAQMQLNGNFKEALKGKIELDANYKPFFILRRSNEEYLRVNILNKTTVSATTKSIKAFQEVMASRKEAEPVINATKNIFELIEAKDYNAVDAYISDCMAKLIENGDIELTSMDKRNLFLTLQVRFRDIQRVKNTLQNAVEVTPVQTELYNQLDILYRNICETLINAGFYNQEKITRG